MEILNVKCDAREMSTVGCESLKVRESPLDNNSYLCCFCSNNALLFDFLNFETIFVFRLHRKPFLLSLLKYIRIYFSDDYLV